MRIRQSTHASHRIAFHMATGGFDSPDAVIEAPLEAFDLKPRNVKHVLRLVGVEKHLELRDDGPSSSHA